MYRQIARSCVELGLASVAEERRNPEAGALPPYGVSDRDQFRSAANCVDRILRGAMPAELPIEQRTRFELVPNMKTAKALGLPPPSAPLLLADEVIR